MTPPFENQPFATAVTALGEAFRQGYTLEMVLRHLSQHPDPDVCAAAVRYESLVWSAETPDRLNV